MTSLHPAIDWLLRASEAGVRLFLLSPGQKRPVPPRPVIAILVDDGMTGIEPAGPAGFDQALLKELLRSANSSVLTVGTPHEQVFAAAVTLATHNRDGLVLLVETTREFEAAWIELLNRRATLPPVAVDLSEARQ